MENKRGNAACDDWVPDSENGAWRMGRCAWSESGIVAVIHSKSPCRGFVHISFLSSSYRATESERVYRHVYRVHVVLLESVAAVACAEKRDR